MRTALWTLALIGSLAASPFARADLDKGAYAPDISAKEWLNTPEAISLKDTRGLVVVLYFWVSFHRAGELLLDEVNVVHNLVGNRGVMVIGVTDSDRSRVQKSLEAAKVNFPVALESKVYEEYRISEFPRVVVIDAHGKVFWSGAATDGNSAQRAILDALAETPPTRTRPDETRAVHRRLGTARDALKKNEYREAFNAAREAIELAVTGDQLKVTCQDMLELIDMLGRDKLFEVDGYIDEKEYSKAVENIRWIIRNFFGTEVARDAKRKLTQLRKQYKEVEDLMKGHQQTSEAAKLLGDARRDILAQRFGNAWNALQKIVTDHKDTEVAPIAEGILARMRENPQVMSEVNDKQAERDCENWLASARNFIAAGRNKDAEEQLRRVIDKYPGTRYSRDAVEMLKGLR